MCDAATDASSSRPRAGLAWRGTRKRSLNRSGAAAAFAVGFLSFVASTRSGILLIAVRTAAMRVCFRVIRVCC